MTGNRYPLVVGSILCFIAGVILCLHFVSGDDPMEVEYHVTCDGLPVEGAEISVFLVPYPQELKKQADSSTYRISREGLAPQEAGKVYKTVRTNEMGTATLRIDSRYVRWVVKAVVANGEHAGSLHYFCPLDARKKYVAEFRVRK
jgi:hypothetical protein